MRSLSDKKNARMGASIANPHAIHRPSSFNKPARVIDDSAFELQSNLRIHLKESFNRLAKGESSMTRAGLLKLLGRCIAWGFAIEAPILALFLSLQDRMHISIIPGILFVFHLPSYYLTRFLLAAFRSHISTSEYNSLGASLTV